MNPLRISGAGYGRFDNFTLDIPAGSVAIVGPNGAGKSRLLGALELALFAGRGELAQWLAPGSDRLLLELEFEHDGETYRVRRTFTSGSRGKQAVDFERRVGLAEQFADAGHPFPAAAAAFAGPNLELAGAEWEALTREDAKATDQLICDTLGLTRATFGASAFLAQGNTGDFAEATAADRKQLLGAMLDPHGLWPKLADRAKTDAKTALEQISVLQAQIAEREQRLQEVPLVDQRVDTLIRAETAERGDLAEAEQLLEAAQKAVVDNAAAAERARTLTTARDHAQAERDRAARQVDETRAAAAELADTDEKLTVARKLAVLVPELERKVAEQQTAREQAAVAQRTRAEFLAAAKRHTDTVARLRQEGDQLTGQHTALTRRLVDLRNAEDGTERCDRCDQLLGAESKTAALASLTAELDELEAKISAKVDATLAEERLAEQAATDAAGIQIPDVPTGDLTPELTTARDAQMRVGALTERVEQLRRATAQLPELTQALELRESELAQAVQELASADTAPDTPELDRELAEAKSRVSTRRSTLEATVHDLTRARQQLEQLADAGREHDALVKQRDHRHAELDGFRLAERAFGRDGIPTLIAENAIPAIEAEANRILELMPTAKGETLRVELRTQRELKSADHLRETLDILACDAHGPRAYETYSGGEKGRLNVALRLALAQLLAHRRGAESRVLCLDEVEYLDQLGQEQLVDVIRSVAGAYDRVLVVSHAAGVRDAFETVVELTSDVDGVSHLVAPQPVYETVIA